MVIKKPADIPPSDIMSKSTYFNRRKLGVGVCSTPKQCPVEITRMWEGGPLGILPMCGLQRVGAFRTAMATPGAASASIV